VLCERIGQRLGIVQSLIEITKSLWEILPAELKTRIITGKDSGACMIRQGIPAIFMFGYSCRVGIVKAVSAGKKVRLVVA